MLSPDDLELEEDDESLDNWNRCCFCGTSLLVAGRHLTRIEHETCQGRHDGYLHHICSACKRDFC